MSVVLTYSTGVPTLKVGRIAGQFAKPRSSPTEKRDGIELPSYLGDIVNDFEFEAVARRPDPAAHGARLQPGRGDAQPAPRVHQGRLRRPQRGVHQWNLEFIASRARGPPLRRARRRRSSGRCASWPRAASTSTHEAQLHEVDFYTSHEALLLGYEEALTRRDSLTGDWYDCSAHLLWIGAPHPPARRRARGVPLRRAEPDRPEGRPRRRRPTTLVALCRRLDPGREPGRLTLVSRMGADHVARAPAAACCARCSAAGHPVVWACDPMHGNTFVHESGYKTRHFDAVMHEVEQFFDVLPRSTTCGRAACTSS